MTLVSLLNPTKGEPGAPGPCGVSGLIVSISTFYCVMCLERFDSLLKTKPMDSVLGIKPLLVAQCSKYLLCVSFVTGRHGPRGHYWLGRSSRTQGKPCADVFLFCFYLNSSSRSPMGKPLGFMVNYLLLSAS